MKKSDAEKLIKENQNWCGSRKSFLKKHKLTPSEFGRIQSSFDELERKIEVEKKQKAFRVLEEALLKEAIKGKAWALKYIFDNFEFPAPFNKYYVYEKDDRLLTPIEKNNTECNLISAAGSITRQLRDIVDILKDLSEVLDNKLNKEENDDGSIC